MVSRFGLGNFQCKKYLAPIDSFHIGFWVEVLHSIKKRVRDIIRSEGKCEEIVLIPNVVLAGPFFFNTAGKKCSECFVYNPTVTV